MDEHLLIAVASVIILGIGAQWIAGRLRLPSILLLLIFGFIAGPILNLVNPDETFGDLLFPIVSLSVALILFEGGLTLRLSEIPDLRNVIFRLISVGAIITWAVATLASHYIIGLDWALSLLLGAILIVTGPTVVGPLLRQIRPQGKSGIVLKWEGILIDPIGAVLAVLIFEAILEGDLGQAPGLIALGVLQTMLIGLGLGVLGAAFIIILFRRFWVPDHLQNGMTLLVVMFTFVLSNVLHPEAGLLTVTVMGVVLANQSFVSIKHIVEFKENLQVLLIGTLFILLASRLQLRDITSIGWAQVVFLAVLVFVARPRSVFISSVGSGLTGKEKIFMSWMAPRGIVAASIASVFAFELIEAGHRGAEQLVAMTFLVIIGTVLLYGLTAGPLARRLGLSERDPQGALIIGAHAMGRSIAQTFEEQGFRAVLVDSDPQNVRIAQHAGLEAHHADALTESTLEDLNYNGLGRLLAMTSNYEVNSLAVLHYQEIFGRAESYQLTGQIFEDSEEPMPKHLRGRVLFGKDYDAGNLCQRLSNGATIQETEITEDFDYPAFKARYEDQAVPLFLVRLNGKLVPYTDQIRPVPRAGQKLISMIPPVNGQEDEQAAEGAGV